MTLVRFTLILVSCFTTCLCFIPEYSFYQERNEGGDSMILKNSWTGAPPRDIITTHKSHCYQGLWLACDAGTFTGNCIDGFYRNRTCINTAVMPSVKSVRRSGPSDSATPHISFYNEKSYRGLSAEVSVAIADLIGPNALTRSPLSLYSTGWSNWTFYAQPNWGPPAVCYHSNLEVHAVEDLSVVYGGSIRSVVSGCRGAIDKYILASSLENGSLKN